MSTDPHVNQFTDEQLKSIASKIRLIVFDFDGVFTDNRVLVMQDGTEAVYCNRSDGLGIGIAKENGIDVMVISKEQNPVVSARCSKLNIECIQGCDDKESVLKQISRDRSIPLENIAYMGNDVNDIGCLKVVGLPACVKDSHRDLFPIVRYISKLEGGQGAVREFCEFIVNASTSG